MSWRFLEDVLNIFCLPRPFEDVSASCLLKYILTAPRRRLENTSWRNLRRRLKDVLQTRLASTSWRPLKDVLEDEKLLCWRHLQNVFKTSWKTRNVCWDNTSLVLRDEEVRQYLKDLKTKHQVTFLLFVINSKFLSN